ncbi:DUF7482 domain-containing protein [Deinococcus peraridilitoris]|uniref:DUF7482 domain-containing protein n=1 Tax=Deinococcus peraridilitoris (strain DSM 19664 / LMG 22246 / CIP 109416 / KR-200) TaxID=937777 RepID=L0A756_DEIPD|nr:hypothetical protein [Deinococcus peraridilitoris]AFZ69284.1 hypothetical protein Deipe_3869 [Deinococcus peraridilitoris DSM 19664]
MARNLIVTTIVAVLMAGFVLAYLALNPAAAQGGMGDMGGMTTSEHTIPPVQGYAAGEKIFFLHTETSDPQVAEMLTSMMGSPVLVVPALAKVPKEALADLYVFTNGLKGGGPLGFQPDVFDRPPGEKGYSPLRALNQVTWKNPGRARVLKSAEAVQQDAQRGEVTLKRTGIVVNTPFVTWPQGGHR